MGLRCEASQINVRRVRLIESKIAALLVGYTDCSYFIDVCQQLAKAATLNDQQSLFLSVMVRCEGSDMNHKPLQYFEVGNEWLCERRVDASLQRVKVKVSTANVSC